MSRAWNKLRSAATVVLLLFGAASGEAAPAVAESQDPSPPKRVLMLYGHDPHAPGVVAFTNQVHAIVRSDSTPRVVFYDELLDLDRFPENAGREEIVDDIVEKYRGSSFDAILTDGARALKFAIERVSARFPGVPIVYGMAFEPEVDFSALPKNVTGIHQPLPFAATLKLARALQPDAERVVFVAGTGRTDSLLLAAAVSDMTPLLGGMQLVVWQDWTYASLLESMRTLPPHTITVLAGFSRDRGGQQFNEGDLIASVTRLASAPVYGIARNWVGDGVVGGVTMDFGDDGLHTGRLLLQVLDRASGGLPLPPPEIARPSQVVDWRALQRWGLSERQLPPGTEVLFRTPTVWDRYKGYVMGGAALLAVQALFIVGLLVERKGRRRAEAKLRTSLNRIHEIGGRLLNAQDIERTRIAQELHDDVSQQLAALKWNLQLLSGMANDEALSVASEAVQHVDGLLTSIRELSHSLYPARLQMFGLVPALEGLLSELSDHGPRMTFTSERVPEKLPPDVTVALFRVAQEALQNALKHSRAENVWVKVSGDADRVALAVVDDGVGFVVDGTLGDGLGLISIGERVESIGGTWKVESSPLRGTTVQVTIPLSESRADAGSEKHSRQWAKNVSSVFLARVFRRR